jgi:ribosomal-protein-alanine N-acetyltransferase
MEYFSYLEPMKDSDLSWVLALEQRSYDFPWSLKGFENSLERGINSLFYCIKGQKLGYCCILPVLDEAHILNVCVARVHQGKGVATAALKKILTKLYLNGYQVALLEVRESNHSAIKLYQSLGFQQDGIRKDYYRTKCWNESQCELVEERENAILMSFSLANLS